MQAVLRFLDDLWNIRWIKGHRTTIARTFLYAVSAALFYQTAATSTDLIAAGIDLKDLSPSVLAWLAGLSSYFATKIAQFAKEHQLA